MQVITPENFQEFIETRKVPEFKPPEAAKVDDKAKPDEGKKEEPKRDDSGKFVAADKVDKDTGAKPEEDDDADLSEKVRRKIGNKHRLMKEAEEFAERQYHERKAAERRAELLEQELQGYKTKSRPEPEAKKEAPKPDDFKTVAEYADALTDFKLEQKLTEYRAGETARLQKEAADKQKAEFAARIVKTMKDIPDYDEVVSEVDTEVPPHIQQYIVQSDIGPLVGYHLAKYPDELDRINKLSPVRAIAELGKLELKLEKKPDPEPVKVEVATPAISKAPPPITPLDGKSTPVHKDPATMTFQELREYDRQQRVAKRR